MSSFALFLHVVQAKQILSKCCELCGKKMKLHFHNSNSQIEKLRFDFAGADRSSTKRDHIRFQEDIEGNALQQLLFII